MRAKTSLLATTLLFGALAASTVAAPPKESDLVGKWQAQGSTVELQSNKQFIWQQGGQLKIAGTWKIDAGDVKLTPVTLNGQPVGVLKKRLLSRPAVSAAAKAYAEDLDKPNFFTVGKDGKSMITDPKRDRNSGPAIKLKKLKSGLSTA